MADRQDDAGDVMFLLCEGQVERRATHGVKFSETWGLKWLKSSFGCLNGSLLQDSSQWSPKLLRPWCEPGLWCCHLSVVWELCCSMLKLSKWQATMGEYSLISNVDGCLGNCGLSILGILGILLQVRCMGWGHGMISQPRPSVRWWWEPWAKHRSDCALSKVTAADTNIQWVSPNCTVGGFHQRTERCQCKLRGSPSNEHDWRLETLPRGGHERCAVKVHMWLAWLAPWSHLLWNSQQHLPLAQLLHSVVTWFTRFCMLQQELNFFDAHNQAKPHFEAVTRRPCCKPSKLQNGTFLRNWNVVMCGCLWNFVEQTFRLALSGHIWECLSMSPASWSWPTDDKGHVMVKLVFFS